MQDEFKPRSWGAHPIDLEKEYNAWEDSRLPSNEVPDKPEALSTSLVRRGLIDPNTGLRTGNSKQEFISSWTPSRTFQENYQRIFSHA